MEGHLVEFAALLGVLAGAAAVSVWLRLPVVPLYIAAGVAIGALHPGPDASVAFLGSLGVVFLLFSLGLEFSVAGLTRDARGFLGAGSVDWLFNFPVGLAAGWALGLSLLESLVLAGILYMSSSAVVTKCLVEFERAARPETETVLKILVFEDFAIAIFLVLLQPFLAAGSGELSFGLSELWSLARAFAFVMLLLLIARHFTGPLERLLAARSEEAFTLVLFAFVLGVASAALAAGLSEAIGAFLAGLALGGTSLKARAARTLLPFQTVFAALFFISFGMGIDLASVGRVVLPAVVLVVLGLTTKTLGGFLAGRLAGHASGPALAVGVSLIPKGEFSVVLAGLAAGAGVAGSSLEALTGLYVFALSILGPLAMREADRFSGWITRPPPPPREPEPTPP